MALILVTGPAKEPVTLERAKAQLRLDTDDDDELVTGLMKVARTHIEGQTKRALITQTWDENIDNNWPWHRGGPRIVLPLNPLQSVTSISYQDESGTSPQPTLAAADYTVVARTSNSYIVPAYNVSWPSVRSVPNAITVRFVAGYGTVPKPLEQAILLLVAHLYETREPAGSQQIEHPYTVEALISPYRHSGQKS